MQPLSSKQRSYLKKLGAAEKPIYQIGKASLTPELCEAISEALEAREIVKLEILKNCFDDKTELADTVAGRTRSVVVQIIGRRIVLYRESKTKKKIELP